MGIGNSIKVLRKSPQVMAFGLKAGKALRPVSHIAHSKGPEILVASGIIGGTTAAILGARATLKLEAIIDLAQKELELVRLDSEAMNSEGPVYDAAWLRKRSLKIKANAAGKIAKLYAPAATLGAASIVAILGAHNIMSKRNVALAAAYKALETSFDAYRKRVIEEFGEDKDRDYRLGFVDEETTDKKTGIVNTVTKVEGNMPSPYAKYFDENSTEWTRNSNEYNLIVLRNKQNYFNDRLKAIGHVFLNEVYDSLDIPRTKTGAVCGWVLSDHPDSDNYIDFNIYDFGSDKARQFVNGYEKAILLDFNVDGVIIDRI